MNQILQKACDELAKDTPNIAYVRGMLDTLLSINKIPEDAFLLADGKGNVRVTTPEKEIRSALASQDEAAILDAKAAAMLASMPPIQMQ